MNILDSITYPQPKYMAQQAVLALENAEGWQNWNPQYWPHLDESEIERGNN